MTTTPGSPDRSVAVRFEPYSSVMAPEVARVLAGAFVTNPLHIAAFGPGRFDRNEAFFRLGLGVMKGPKFVAIDRDRIVGAIHWVKA